MLNSPTTPVDPSSPATASIGLDELRQFVGDAAPNALLTPPRLLRRIIKADRGIRGLLLAVPHRRTYCLSREALLKVTTRQELGLDESHVVPDRLLLLSCSPQRLADEPRPAVLLHFWRLLFHVSIDDAIAGSFSGKTPAMSVKQHLDAAETAEVEQVLRSDGWLLPPRSEESCLAEFAAVYLELRFFQPDLLACTFPSLAGNTAVDAALCELVDAQALFARTRLAGAPEPSHARSAGKGKACQPSSAEAALAAELGPPISTADADVARQHGNLVRSAILRTWATDSMGAEAANPFILEAGKDMDALAARLQRPLSLTNDEVMAWRSALPKLLAPASTGLWPPAARLLYDLQTVCTDCERETYAVDLVEWVCSLGRKAIVRPLPQRADVLCHEHLRKARARLKKIGGDHEQLDELLQKALHRAEERLREKIRPLLAATFQEVGFVPVNVPETLARENIVEELLDRICERGFINMGDVRDAVSRNQLKIPDAGPLQVLLGDQLLKSNRLLAVSLDGVFHRGEIYLRWLQRLSSMLFGNRIGRWLVLFVLVPFGGALATGVFLNEILHLAGVSVHIARKPIVADERVQGLIGYIMQALSDERHPGPRGERDKHGHLSFRISPLEAIAALLVVGSYFLLLLHLAAVRAGTLNTLGLLWTVLRGIFYDGPWWLVGLPRVRAFLERPSVKWIRRWLLRPALASLIGLALWTPFGFPGAWDDLQVGLSMFALALVFFNTALARRAEEAVTDWLHRNWHSLLFLGASLLAWVVDLSRFVLDRIERVIYAVDEWLCFRQGDSRLSLAWKLFAGLLWFMATYVIRIVIHLFVEPTVNPVKHFPAVTVGAKLLFPIYPAILSAVTVTLTPFVGEGIAVAAAGLAVILVPGIFGFAVWEFKENWKLYQANRAQNLRPVAIGHHGETVARLLRPGFHSGTVPKAFGKLRHAVRDGNERRTLRQRENLHHVSETVARFVKRELLALLKLSKSGGGLHVEVGKVHLATNRIRVELLCSSGEPTALSLVESNGTLQGVTETPGWIARLTPVQAAVFRTALAGWFRLAGVDTLCEGGGPETACAGIPWAEWVSDWEKERQK